MMFGNSTEYNIVGEVECAELLQHFNSDFIFNVIRNSLDNKFKFNAFLPVTNVVGSFEQNFKVMQNNYPSDRDNIIMVRLSTYNQIIDLLCKDYNLQFNNNEDLEHYSVAYYLYDFLVANYKVYMIYFFASFIHKEKNYIYDSLNLEALKKNKDSSTIYGKKVYKDTKIAVISTNLDYVLNNIRSFDIDLDIILNTVTNKNVASLLLNYISPINDFYKEFYCSAINSEFYPELLTNIRLEIQKLSIVE